MVTTLSFHFLLMFLRDRLNTCHVFRHVWHVDTWHPPDPWYLGILKVEIPFIWYCLLFFLCWHLCCSKETTATTGLSHRELTGTGSITSSSQMGSQYCQSGHPLLPLTKKLPALDTYWQRKALSPVEAPWVSKPPFGAGSMNPMVVLQNLSCFALFEHCLNVSWFS